MALLRRISLTIQVDGSGDATDYTVPVHGFLYGVFMDYDALDTGADFTITEESSGKALLTITNAGTSDLAWYPRIGSHPVANTAGGTIVVGGATTGGEGTVENLLSVVGRIKVVTAQGGVSLSGALHFDIIR